MLSSSIINATIQSGGRKAAGEPQQAYPTPPLLVCRPGSGTRAGGVSALWLTGLYNILWWSWTLPLGLVTKVVGCTPTVDLEAVLLDWMAVACSPLRFLS